MTDYRIEPPVPDDDIPYCPVCGKECDTVYVDIYDDVIGCDRCVFMEDAYADQPPRCRSGFPPAD